LEKVNGPSGPIIDQQKIPIPKIEVSARARLEIELIRTNDFTLDGQKFRLFITSKGCEGFTYGAGFDVARSDDLIVTLPQTSEFSLLELHLDPFTAYYLQSGRLDFVFDPALNVDGFVVKNTNQTSFYGKFWTKDDTKVPPLINEEKE